VLVDHGYTLTKNSTILATDPLLEEYPDEFVQVTR
jgi:hypothetical protein